MFRFKGCSRRLGNCLGAKKGIAVYGPNEVLLCKVPEAQLFRLIYISLLLWKIPQAILLRLFEASIWKDKRNWFLRVPLYRTSMEEQDIIVRGSLWPIFKGGALRTVEIA